MKRNAPYLVAAYCNALREVFVRRKRWWPVEERFARVWKWLGEVEGGDGMGVEMRCGVEEGKEGEDDVGEGDEEEGRRRKRVKMSGS